MDHHRLSQEMANALDVEVSLSPQQRPRTRQKLIPWLRERVNSGQVPGVSWENKAKTVVKIQWTRKSQHDYNVDQDGAIFKEWAVHTGRYTEGVDTPDPSRWKTNFRCAMNKSTEAEYLRDQSQEQGDNPYRLYRLSQPSTDDAYHTMNGHHASPVLDEECELLIEPHYGNDRLFRTKPSKGCLIHPPNFMRNGFHVAAELVALPQFTGGNAYKREQYNKVFRHLDKGIAFGVLNNDLYVTRHCRVRVFCRMAGGKVVRLGKGAKTKVFDYAKFMTALEDYATGVIQQRPETQVFINIGQNHPGPPNAQALVTVVLHHVTAEQRLRTVDASQPNMGMIG
uniref:Interferon regulatory factor 2 n=1 Tax=Branchiostoma belcheri tsingtauense TaxID=155462 RepID=A0A0A7PCA9_BRABE|nr:interferon regulatory factor 2 [Branchiostoma belcheri tsingtauense]